jgi:MoaA/NifB/PqqE/SkfB family radical SAM enzyme
MNTYTSTGRKILRHLDALKGFQDTGMIRPISLQIAPTSRCNLNCSFCSNANRDKHEDLNLSEIMGFMKQSGAKTVEWTGGGDPTQYENMNRAILFAAHLKLKQGMITNGIDLVKNINHHIEYLDWIRISLNALEYVDDIDIPKFSGVLGFSYVMNKNTTVAILEKVRQFVKKHPPKYVRVVPDCQTTSEELQERNKCLSFMVESWGSPYFYQAKTFTQPKRCWWGHFKPFLLHDGFVYPCSSVVLNDTAGRSFHEKFRWMEMCEFIKTRNLSAEPFDCKDCTSCVFGEQNALIEAVIDPSMENFI